MNWHDVTLEKINTSTKILFTCVLLIFGMAYMFAMLNIYYSHAGRDGKPGVSVEDIKIAYRGDHSKTKLEGALNGPMNGMLPQKEKESIIKWIRDGAPDEKFDKVRPILENRCFMCHDGSNPHLPNLSDLEELKSLSEMDHGMSVATLVRVSHIHLFGLTFIFTIMGLVFIHSYTKRPWLKYIVIMVPFLAIFMDVLSWWLTKVSDTFGYVVIISGTLMGLSFTWQLLVSLYQMWLFKCPQDTCKAK